MKIDLNFSHNYEIEVLEGLSSSEKAYYYPGGITQGGMDGLIIKVVPLKGESWIGIFAFGNLRGISGIYTLPNPNKVCVVSKGKGYFVSAENPTEWMEIKSIPIIDVRSVSSQDIILFADYTELVAYNSYGLKWQTDRLAFDSFKIIKITESHLIGEYYNIRSESIETFEVDLLTGKHIGSIKLG